MFSKLGVELLVEADALEGHVLPGLPAPLGGAPAQVEEPVRALSGRRIS